MSWMTSTQLREADVLLRGGLRQQANGLREQVARQWCERVGGQGLYLLVAIMTMLQSEEQTLLAQ